MTVSKGKPIQPLTSADVNGSADAPPTADNLIKVQNAVLMSNATVLGAVNEFRTGIDQRLTRKFGEVATQIGKLDEKVDGVCGQVNDLEEARRTTALLAEQANRIAVHADDVAVKHSLSTNARIAIIVGAFFSGCGVVLGLANFVAGK